MKTTYFVLTACLIGSLLLSGCSGSKKAFKNPMDEEVEITNLPFSDFKSDQNYIRMVGIALSPDMNIAKKLATNNAYQDMALQTESFVKYVLKTYADQYAVGETNDLDQHMQMMGETVAKQFLRGAAVKDFKLMRNRTSGDYRCFAAVEMPSAELQKAMKENIEKLPQQTKDRIRMNENNFQQVFDNAMLEYDFEKGR